MENPSRADTLANRRPVAKELPRIRSARPSDPQLGPNRLPAGLLSYNAYGELETLTTWRDTRIDFSTDSRPNPGGGDVTTWNYQPATGLLTRKNMPMPMAPTSLRQCQPSRSAHLARDGGLDTTYSYDPATGELLRVDYEAVDTADIHYSYDRLGRQSSISDATGTRTLATTCHAATDPRAA